MMKISVVSYSLSDDPETLESWKNKVLNEIRMLEDSGSDVILYPELFLMGLSRYLNVEGQSKQVRAVAELLHSDIYPWLSRELTGQATIVFGSGPRLVENAIFNSSAIFHHGKTIFQDKLYLTPWETDFVPGTEIRLFDLKGLKTCVMICFDSEQPDLAVKLKQESLDLMLLPSATTNRNGSQRVNRCASARSVELGAVVVTSPLVGDSACELVDHNEGRQGFFLPAQECISIEQEQFSAYSVSEHIVSSFEFDDKKIKELKKANGETKPFLEKIKNHIVLKKEGA